MRRLRLTDAAGTYQQEDAHWCAVVRQPRSSGTQPLSQCTQGWILADYTLGQLIFQTQ
ncbi:hypothetical protein D3C76_338870 [compost metagenome]